MTREQWDDLYAAYKAIWPQAARFAGDTAGAWYESGMHRLSHEAAGDALMVLAGDATHPPGLANWIAATHAAAVTSAPRRTDTGSLVTAEREWRVRWAIQHRRITSTSAEDPVRARFIEWLHEPVEHRVPAVALLVELERLAESPPLLAARRGVGDMPR